MNETSSTLEEYAVSEACIACDACCNDFPEIFKMNADHTRAEVYAPSPKGKINPWDAIYVCPVDAISLIKGDLPPPPANKKPASASHESAVPEMDPIEIEDNRPWEVRWEEAQARGPESSWERMKRYGTALHMDETIHQYLISLALPETVPNHPMKYKWNLPEKMPDYKIDVQLGKDGKKILLKGCLEDARVKRLCGVANSFPDRFFRELSLTHPAKELKFNYNPKDKVLDVVADKAE